MLKRNLEQKKLSGPVHPKETANTTAALPVPGPLGGLLSLSFAMAPGWGDDYFL